MILETKKFKDVCSKILSSIDKSGDASGLSEVMELKAEGNTLYLGLTNREYFISLKFPLDREENFKAVISASLFLKLISQLTTETMALIINDKFVEIKANGDYKIPLIYSNDKMIELDPITIENPTVEMKIDGDILRSILHYNSKEIQRGVMSDPTIQRLHYVDDQGALTFTSTGVCVNKFSLPKHIQILLNNKLVKLFKLFEEDEVDFTLGYDAISDDIIQTKIQLETPSLKLNAILNCDDSLIRHFPISKIRDKSNEVYPYTVTINKNNLISAINRLLVFTSALKSKPVGYMIFNSDGVTISDLNKENKETFKCDGFKGEEYSLLIDLNTLKSTLEDCNELYLNLSFGNNLSVLINRLNIINIMTECDIY